MRSLIFSSLAAAATLAATPVSAAVVLGEDGTTASVGSTTTAGSFFDINFTTDPISGLTSFLRIIFQSLDAGTNTWTFAYSLQNTSGAQIDAARVSGFGFDIDPNRISATIIDDTNGFTRVGTGNISDGTSVEVCLTGQNDNCNAGGGTGFGLGETASGIFALTIGTNTQALTFSNFVTRYQGINSTQLGISDGSAIGIGTAVPEPGTWLLMILGLGAVGFAMRRRQRTAVRFQFA
jgi:hypothetical protein